MYYGNTYRIDENGKFIGYVNIPTDMLSFTKEIIYGKALYKINNINFNPENHLPYDRVINVKLVKIYE